MKRVASATASLVIRHGAAWEGASCSSTSAQQQIACRLVCSSMAPRQGQTATPPPGSDGIVGEAASTSSQPEAEGHAQPGWLRGPQQRKTAALKEVWVEATDPASGRQCWRNTVTGEHTQPGVPKPQTWHQIVDKKTGLIYYWCPASGETTTIGEPEPGPQGRHAAYREADREKGAGAAGGSGAAAAGDKKKGEEKGDKELTITQLYNNPLGWLLLGMAVFGIVLQQVGGAR